MTTMIRKLKKSIAKFKGITLVSSNEENQGKPEEKRKMRKQIKEKRKDGKKNR